MTKLAINGGQPIRNKEWPSWPAYSEEIGQQLIDVAKSGRWTISGPYSGHVTKERLFAQKFAQYNNVPYCTPTSSGSSSLLISLEALGIGAGDEVIVPALTWVATASAVVNVNALPVIVDLEPGKLTISPEKIKAAITEKTKAIIPVHLYCSVANLDEIQRIASDFDLLVIEDCAQAHGAEWNGKKVGTYGHTGAFSMQQEKVLTCGEGGAVITKDQQIAAKLEQLRSDSRIFSESQPRLGHMELIEKGDIMGSNYCLSEFNAAILLSQIDKLEEQNSIRRNNAEYLNSKLSKIEGIKSSKNYSQVNKITYYQYLVNIDSEFFSCRSLSSLCEALEAELTFLVDRTDPPLSLNPLFCPKTKRRYNWNKHYWESLDYTKTQFPIAQQVYNTHFMLHHSILLGEKRDMDDIVAAFEKISKYSDCIPTRGSQCI